MDKKKFRNNDLKERISTATTITKKFRNEDLKERISTATAITNDIFNTSERILKDLGEMVRLIESFENRYCKDTIGRELGISYLLKFRDMKVLVHGSFSLLKKFVHMRPKLSLAFDSMIDKVELRKDN